MNAFVLAAGLGTRLRPLTDKITKPAVPFFNIPLLYHSLYILEKLNIKNIVLNTHHLPKQIHKLMASTESFKFEFSDEQPDVLGTGGGLKKARPLFKKDEPILVLNGDNLFLDIDLEEIKKSIDQHKRSKSISTLLTTDHPLVGTKFGGVWVDHENKILSIGKEKPEKYKYGFHYIGIQIVSPEVFDYLPNGISDLWKDGLNPAIKDNKVVSASQVRCDWYETGNEESFVEAGLELFKKKESSSLSSFFSDLIQKFSDGSKFINNNFVGQNLKLEKKVVLSGHNVIGNNVSIGEGSHLENIVVLNNTQIPARSLIKNKIIY